MKRSFCSVGTPGFLDLQVAIFGSDKILSLALKTDGGQHPPVHFLASAWAQTIQYFAEQVRLTHKPLAEFVQNTGSWEHRWTWSRPNNNVGSGNSHRDTDLPAEIVAEMKRLREESRINQSLNDRLRTELSSFGLTGIEGNSKGERKGNKGGGKNGDKGKNKLTSNKDAHNKNRRSRSRGRHDRRGGR